MAENTTDQQVCTDSVHKQIKQENISSLMYESAMHLYQWTKKQNCYEPHTHTSMGVDHRVDRGTCPPTF